MSPAKKERVDYLDAIKGISILLVVFCHFPVLSEQTIAGNIVMSVAAAGVPCFMMVSGALQLNKKNLQPEKYFALLRKSYFGIVAWKAVYLLIYRLCNHVPVPYSKLIAYFFLFGHIDQVNTDVMWYMEAYLLILLLYPLLFLAFSQADRMYLHCLLAVSFLSGFGIVSISWGIRMLNLHFGWAIPDIQTIYQILPLERHANLIFFFLLGGVLYREREKLAKADRGRYGSIAVFLLGIAGLVLIKKIESGTFRWKSVFLQAGYSHFSTILLAIGLCGLLFYFTGGRIGRMLGRYIGRETLGIYYLHFLLLGIFSGRVMHVTKLPYGFWTHVLQTLTVTGGCLILICGMKKIPLLRRWLL